MKVVLYPRVSTSVQVKKGDSIEAQIRRLKEFCEINDYEIVGTYTDAGKSATIKGDNLKQRVDEKSFTNTYKLDIRPGFKRLLREASSGKFDAIIFYKWDRFARDIAFAELSIRYFEKYNIKLVPTDDSEDPLVSSIVRAMGKAEVDKMKERVRSTRLKRFEDGMMVGRCPYGYRFDNKKNIVPDKKKARIVRKVFQKTAEGINYREICSKYGLKPQSYYNILKNKVYIGIISFEGVEKKGSHSSIISEELFNSVQQLK